MQTGAVGWFVVLVVGVLAFAVVYDLVTRARGRYRPPAVWEAARAARKEERHRHSFLRQR